MNGKKKIKRSAGGRILLFVYGSLKRGFCRNGILDDEKFLGEAVTEPDFLLYDLGPFPALVAVGAGKGKSIRGELYDVGERCVSYLDVIEGSPNFYKLEPARLSSHPGRVVFAYVFQQGCPNGEECGECWSPETLT